eukprot:1275414-Ditylum_brightwellii.AAC.1
MLSSVLLGWSVEPLLQSQMRGSHFLLCRYQRKSTQIVVMVSVVGSESYTADLVEAVDRNLSQKILYGRWHPQDATC